MAVSEHKITEIYPAEIQSSHHYRIQPSKGLVSLRLKEFWEYRELLFFLIWRDVKVRYKQAYLGIGWAVIQPVMTMIVFSIFFGKLGKMASDNVPYPVFSFAALVPWTLFATGLTNAANSLVGNANLIKKVYFPRLIIPLSNVLAGTVDFLIALVILFGLTLVYGIFPTVKIVWLPLFFLLALMTSMSVSLWLSALNVKYRDVKYLISFLTQLWLFATPVAYPSSLLPEPYRTLYGINPMVGVVEGFRWALLGTNSAPGWMTLISTVVAFALLVSGAFYFRQMEKSFADVV